MLAPRRGGAGEGGGKVRTLVVGLAGAVALFLGGVLVGAVGWPMYWAMYARLHPRVCICRD